MDQYHVTGFDLFHCLKHRGFQLVCALQLHNAANIRLAMPIAYGDCNGSLAALCADLIGQVLYGIGADGVEGAGIELCALHIFFQKKLRVILGKQHHALPASCRHLRQCGAELCIGPNPCRFLLSLAGLHRMGGHADILPVKYTASAKQQPQKQE